MIDALHDCCHCGDPTLSRVILLEGALNKYHLCRLCDRKLLHLGRIVPGELKDTRYYPQEEVQEFEKTSRAAWLAERTRDLLCSEWSGLRLPA